jgi:hypothetical protein
MKQKQNILTKILEHPDKDEIISKLIIGVEPKEINEWLKFKYINVHESKFILTEKLVKTFKDEYLNIYNDIKEDLIKSKNSINNLEDEINLSIKGNKKYKETIMGLAGKELDVKNIIIDMIRKIEFRANQVFDNIQEDPDNFKADRILIEWFDKLGTILEKYHKLVLGAPDQVIQHNITVQVIDQHIAVFHDTIKEILSVIDLETSMLFMEKFEQNISKLKSIMPDQTAPIPVDVRLLEAQNINEIIGKKLNN